MQIDSGMVVAFSYVLKDESGDILESSPAGEPTVYLHGYRNILRGLEEAMVGKHSGEALTVTLPPERGYGLRRPNATQRIPVKHLLTKQKRYLSGMTVKVNTHEGARDVVITKVGKFNVDVDTNHPFSGKTLTFELLIESVRAATDDEKSHRHSHGVDGHHHHG